MNQVFVSYRHVEPDQGLADGLCAHLERHRIRVFLDKHIQVGLNWVEEIDRQLRASGAFVVLLSEASIRSDMVRQEVQTAYQLLLEGKMAIFPVHVNLDESLPYDLASYLNRIQYAVWRSGDSPQNLWEQLRAAICGDSPLALLPRSDDDLLPIEPAVVGPPAGPLPTADPRAVLETGTIHAESQFYVRRPSDDIAEGCLTLRGNTVVVKGPRQSGKSSLLARLFALSRRQGLRSVYVDFQMFDAPQLASLGNVLHALAVRIARALRTNVNPKDVWDAELLGEKGSFGAFLEAAILSPTLPAFVLLLDEVDRLFNEPYRDDFFATVRAWHNLRATEEAWEGLHLVLGHATDPALWIENLNQSPFNVGERLRLRDFDRDQVADLNARHGAPLRSDAEIDGLLRLVSGLPYLVRQALHVLARERRSLAVLDLVAASDEGPFGDHLRRHLWSIGQSAKLTAAVSRIVRGRGCDDERSFQRLLAAGLVVGETRGEARMRCNMYQTYFARHV